MLHAEPSFQQPVLVPASCAPTLELQSMFMAIVQPKQCGQLMPALPALPKGMQHLKRVRKRPENEGRLEVLLMPTQSMAEDHSCADGEQGEAREASSSQAASPGIGGELAQLLARLEAAVTEVEVPRWAPWTRVQYLAWNAIWPMSWREREAAVQREACQLPPAEAERMARHMASAWREARRAEAGGGVPNCCRIVDPDTDRVVGQALDSRERHPLRHAPIAAVAEVAAWQLEVWPPGGEAGGKRRRLGPADELAAASGAAPPGGSAPPDGPRAAPDPGERPYLCTGYDCYVVHEPCVMCAMALVHSRLRRVIFCVANSQHGALGGSGIKLHSHKSLNHHYQVFWMPLDQHATPQQ